MRIAPAESDVGVVASAIEAKDRPLTDADRFQASLTKSIGSFLYLRNQSFLPGERGEALLTVEARVGEVLASIYAQIADALATPTLAKQVEKHANAAFFDAFSSFPMPDLPLSRYYHELIEAALDQNNHVSPVSTLAPQKHPPYLRLV